VYLEGHWWEQGIDLAKDREDVFLVRPLPLGDASLSEVDDDLVKVRLELE